MTEPQQNNPAVVDPTVIDPNALVQIRRVRKSFGAHQVLRDISLSVPAGTVTVLLGPSGSGKSTLLRCVNHLETIDGGRIIVDGDLIGYRQAGNKNHEMTPKQIAKQRANIGMVFQKFNLFPHMTALENIMEAPVGVAKRSKSESKQRAKDLLARVGLADFAGHYPAQLSGGQQQRVAIARALAGDPSLILADEPTGNLDSLMARQVLDLLEQINDMGTTIVMVTHDPELARRAHRNVQVIDGQVTDFKPYEPVAVEPRLEATAYA